MSKTKARRKWDSMWIRVRGCTSYKDVNVCEEWEDFDKFYEWIKPYFDKGMVHKNWHMDKDFLSQPDQKIYSPDTCCFLPPEINTHIISVDVNKNNDPFHKGRAMRYKYDIGLWYIDKGSVCGKWLGYFYTKDEAMVALGKFKKKRMKQLVEQYRDMLDPDLIPKLLAWEPVL